MARLSAKAQWSPADRPLAVTAMQGVGTMRNSTATLAPNPLLALYPAVLYGNRRNEQ